ncbi:MAG: peptidoglycan DD-metalloendopeptidase family protein [Balneola sp.]|nr:peptidoglycan DD-metalloendopeptidase family protein [Balneola sp.]MBO6652294.1 peptidoglycan DD-metalloendopeptidase family protein [Balneola sp.]MBO6710739.1 peptidoglycan DD-metalloendopeptidase family protein [Balneola sp.]MBO6799426.1 peptidoglycan DD-metalloendopeptidase family protein [Balneola sp.]MBO6869446.1 peptidoglycan DD-metalloendopeptidase family protein [Balneola sp.]
MVAVCLFQACFVFKEKAPLTKNSVNIEEFEEIEELPGLDDYGYVKNESVVKEAKVKRNESLYIILRSLDVTPEDIYTIQQKAIGKFNPRRINQNQKYYTYHDAETGTPTRMIFHQTATDYVIFDWSNGIEVETGSKEIETEIATAYGTIESSLYETLVGQGVNMLVANGLSEIFGWEIDFFRLYKGDKFKVIYEKRFVDGKPYGIGQIIAAEFEHRGQIYDAYFYESEEAYGYYDNLGNSVQKALLKAPFKYSQRISSNFSYNRFHPVLKRRMPHYGVDYAAPMGTPVISVGDGEIITSRYNGAAGNMVKIRHNSTYSTAYLHLNGYASGIKEGRRVKQGQVIGYVGKTGRVTGVHLHYNVYKNDRPVNPVKLVLPPSKGISEAELETYKVSIESKKSELEKLGKEESLAEVLN